MMPRVVEAKYLGGYRVWLRFKDGLEGELDLTAELWGEVFEPLKEVREFAKVKVNTDLHTIDRPNGADLSPTWLWGQVREAREGVQAAQQGVGSNVPTTAR